MKKQKTKAEKRMEKVRRTITMNLAPDELDEHFCDVFSEIWSEVCKARGDDSEDIDMMEAIVEYCEAGWNAAVISGTMEEAMEYIDRDLAETFPEGEDAKTLLDMIKLAAVLKFRICPDERIPVKAAMIVIEDGEPSISVEFDWEAAGCREWMCDVIDMP